MTARGFTLVEVLVAFAILAIVLGVSFRTIASGLGQERAAEAATARVLLARSILDGLGSAVPLVEGVHDGAADEATTWRLVVTRLSEAAAPGRSAPAAAPALYLVELAVFDGRRPALELATVRMGP